MNSRVTGFTAANVILYEGRPTCKRLCQFGTVQTIKDTRWTEAINKCGVYQLQTLRDRHVKTDRQASSVWFYLSGDPHKKIDRRRCARRGECRQFSAAYFQPLSPSHGLWSCLFGFTSFPIVYLSLTSHWPVFKFQLTLSSSILSRFFNRYYSVSSRFTVT